KRQSSVSRDWSSDVCSSDLGGLWGGEAWAMAVVVKMTSDRRNPATPKQRARRAKWALPGCAALMQRDPIPYFSPSKPIEIRSHRSEERLGGIKISSSS